MKTFIVAFVSVLAVALATACATTPPPPAAPPERPELVVIYEGFGETLHDWEIARVRLNVPALDVYFPMMAPVQPPGPGQQIWKTGGMTHSAADFAPLMEYFGVADPDALVGRRFKTNFGPTAVVSGHAPGDLFERLVAEAAKRLAQER